MNNLCEASAITRGINFSSKTAATEFVHSFDDMLNALAAQKSGAGYTVTGNVTCLGFGQIPESDSDTGKSVNFPCLRRKLQANSEGDKFAFQGVCTQDTVVEEVVPPVEHEGYLLDFKALTIRNKEGKEFAVRRGDIKLFRLLSHTPQTYEELFAAYNNGLESDKKVGRDAIWTNVRHLEQVMGKGTIIRTADKKIMLAGDQL